jgi:5-methylcytosine-specific restriction endonuclease McrA
MDSEQHNLEQCFDIPVWVIDELAYLLTSNEFVTLMAIIRTGSEPISITDISSLAGISRTTALKAIHSLEHFGVITSISSNRHGTVWGVVQPTPQRILKLKEREAKRNNENINKTLQARTTKYFNYEPKPRKRRRLSHLMERIIERDGGNWECHYCGCPVTGALILDYDGGISTPRKANVDHVHPLSKGGSNDISNLVVACDNCNYIKSDMSLEDFLLYLNSKGE